MTSTPEILGSSRSKSDDRKGRTNHGRWFRPITTCVIPYSLTNAAITLATSGPLNVSTVPLSSLAAVSVLPMCLCVLASI